MPNLITSASGSSAQTVIVHSRVVVEDRKIMTFDMNETADRIQQKACKYIDSTVAKGMHPNRVLRGIDVGDDHA